MQDVWDEHVIWKCTVVPEQRLIIHLTQQRMEAGFHILITSYQLLVSDEKYFRRVKWQYMVLDEAQAIKSSNRIENHAEHGGTLNEHQLNRLDSLWGLKPRGVDCPTTTNAE
ncbi:DNA helicase INO80 [Vitis vinifera]|uniref:Chromatin-remodeling ATPase INO80 n=1 Tax=Vitis vinifera TaxID=29760 RepID=A0A438BZU6_VITVI|nr:DNA helicase INO80 [Vitis vinifera]